MSEVTIDELKRHDTEDDATKFDRVASSIHKSKILNKSSPKKSVLPEVGSEVGSFNTLCEKKMASLKNNDPHAFDVKKHTAAEMAAANKVKTAFMYSRVPPGARRAYEEAMWQDEMERRRLKAEKQASLNNTILLGLGFLLVLGLGYYGYTKIVDFAYNQGKLATIEKLYSHLPEAAKSIQH